MVLKLKYEEGIFKPLSKVKGIREGQVVEFTFRDQLAETAMEGGSFDFLFEEEEIYSEEDILKNAKRRHSAG